MKDLVKKALKYLLKKDGATTTTLDVKEYLRNKYPENRFYQRDVSHLCDDIFVEKSIKYLSYNDNGTYREYFLDKPAPIAMTRTDLVELVKNITSGQMITLYYTKADGKEGKTNGRFVEIDNFGYIVITKSRSGDLRKANTRTLFKVATNGQVYIKK